MRELRVCNLPYKYLGTANLCHAVRDDESARMNLGSMYKTFEGLMRSFGSPTLEGLVGL